MFSTVCGMGSEFDRVYRGVSSLEHEEEGTRKERLAGRARRTSRLYEGTDRKLTEAGHGGRLKTREACENFAGRACGWVTPSTPPPTR